jgi:hypothetical protein
MHCGNTGAGTLLFDYHHRYRATGQQQISVSSGRVFCDTYIINYNTFYTKPPLAAGGLYNAGCVAVSTEVVQ